MTKRKNNWILVVSLILTLLFFILGVFVYPFEEIENNRASIDTNFFVYLILAVLVAPVLEEITFRGFFATNKKVKNFSKILLYLSLCLLLFNGFPYLLVAFFSLGITLLVSNKINTKAFTLVYILLSSLIFSLVHQMYADIIVFKNSYFVLMHLAGGLILAWIALNFGIKKSIYTHAAYNLILMLITFYGIQFNVAKSTNFETESCKVVFYGNPYLESNQAVISKDSNALVFKNSSLNNMVKYAAIYYPRITTLNSKMPFSKYTLKIVKKDGAELKEAEVKVAMLKTKLFFEKRNNVK